MRTSALLLGLVLLAAAAPAAGAGGTDDVRRAVAKALPFLEKEGVAWRRERTCLSCHNGAFLLWTHREAERRGFPVAAEKLRAWTDYALDRVADGASPDTLAQVLLAVPPSAVAGRHAELRRAARDSLLHKQAKGFWKPGGRLPEQGRPPREGQEVTSLWAVLALAASDADREASAAARARALAWAEGGDPAQTNELLALRLLVERRWGRPARADGLLRELLGRQNADGDWGWRRDAKASDPLGTGQVLYALRAAVVGAADPAVRRAREFLTRSQDDDGAWPARAEWYSASTDEEYLRGADAIYVYWGSAWATLGLLQTLPEARPGPDCLLPG